MPFVPLGGAIAGLMFGILFGSVSTRRSGTIFALISLGVGELVYAATFMLPGYFGGEEGITANRTRAPEFLRVQHRIAGAGLLRHRCVGARRRDADARLPAHATGAHVQRRARQSRTRGIHRL
jgi:ABC-type branched-subunit amino acid transport system permease subunit